MTANANLPLDEGYGIASLFFSDESEESDQTGEIKQDIQGLREELKTIRDRMELFEDKLTDLVNKKSESPGHNMLLGPSAKSFSEIDLSDPAPELAEDQDGVIGETELNQVFDHLGKPEEIDSLKRQLEDKLRNAEVEMSIQRARVFQQRAELEEMRLQLEQREQAIRKSVAKQSEEDRWDRHFGFARKK